MEAVNAGLNPDLSTFEGIHNAIDQELRYAMDLAIAASTDSLDMTRRRYIQEVSTDLFSNGKTRRSSTFP